MGVEEVITSAAVPGGLEADMRSLNPQRRPRGSCSLVSIAVYCPSESITLYNKKYLDKNNTIL